MILTTLTATALAVYTAKTALNIGRDDSLKQALSKLKSSVSGAIAEAKQDLAEATAKEKAKHRLEELTEQSSLLMSRVFSNATDDEREVLTQLFVKYGSKD